MSRDLKTMKLPHPSRGFVIRAAAAIVVVTVLVTAWKMGLLNDLRPDRLAETRDWARDRFDQQPVLAIAVFVIAYALLAGPGLPVALALSLLAGAVFGPVLGGVALLAGVFFAALVGYGLANSVLLGLTPAGARKSPAVARFVKMVRKDPFLVTLSARLMPILPFNLVNLASGLASTPMKAYAPATFLGVIPTSFIFATMGAGLGDSLEDRASLMDAMRSPTVWGPVLALALLSAVATVVRLRRKDD